MVRDVVFHVWEPRACCSGFYDRRLSLPLNPCRCSAAIGDFLDSVPMGRGAFAAIPTEPQLLSICAACDEAELEAALDAEQLTSNSVCVHTQLPALLTSLKLTLRAFCTCVPHPRQPHWRLENIGDAAHGSEIIRTMHTGIHLTHLSAWWRGCSRHLTNPKTHDIRRWWINVTRLIQTSM
jgi:hypothetical protein